MNSFPKTPTPGKFLPSRRSQTPGGPPRFTPTPARFGASSGARAAAGVDGIEDGDDDEGDYGSESEEVVGSEMADDAIDVRGGNWVAPRVVGRGRGDDVRIENSESEGDEWESSRERGVKRRKVSISPTSSVAISPQEEDEEDEEVGDESIRSGKRDASWELSGSESQGSLDDDLRGTNQQPVFQPAPRFKPYEADDAHGGLVLPEAVFSPQRRGAKYMADGLAAQLQGWLSDVKGWESSDHDAADASSSTSLRIHAEQVQPGRRMCFLEGRVVSGGTSSPAARKRFILAGEGRLTGLGERREVKAGDVVVAGQPMWDVELEGRCWTVACDWGVEA